jgi:hypothetical protein
MYAEVTHYIYCTNGSLAVAHCYCWHQEMLNKFTHLRVLKKCLLNPHSRFAPAQICVIFVQNAFIPQPVPKETRDL